MREQAPTVYTERRAGPSGWALAAVVFFCFMAGFALPRVLGGTPKAAPLGEPATATTRSPAVRSSPVVTPAPEPAVVAAAVVAAPAVPTAATTPPASAPAAPAASLGLAVPATSGDTASTLYERTLVRQSAPEGEIIARIPIGTEVRIVERQNNWYHVKYGANKEGWIYRKSIGK